MFGRRKAFAVAPKSPPPPERRAPRWAEILTVAANSRGITASPEWIARVAALCEGESSREAAIDIAERELDTINAASIERAIADRQNEIKRLRRKLKAGA